jgi:hypothetical protein
METSWYIIQLLLGIIGSMSTAIAVYSLAKQQSSSLSIIVITVCFADFLYSSYFAITSAVRLGLGTLFGSCAMSQIVATSCWLGGIWSVLAVSIDIYQDF